MARSLQVHSFLSRLCVASVIPTASTAGCRFASRGTNKAWMGQSHVHRDTVSKNASRHSDETFDEESELDDVEDKLQALVEEGRKRQKTVKYHILRRQMTPSGAPQRKLTWDAIEQIRYLKQEAPDEWTVERLAEGFSVTPDVLLRVLRSKFVPSPERKAKQDAKVMAELHQQVLPSGAGTEQDRPKLPGNRTPAALSLGSKGSPMVPVVDQALMLQGGGSGSLAKFPAPVNVLPTQPQAGFSKAVAISTGEDKNTTINSLVKDKEDEEDWDGWLLSEEELEEFMEMEKPSPVVQVGKDFFDADGKFVYRI